MRPFSDRAVLLSGKRPIERNWPTRRPSEDEVANHLVRGGNVGVKAGAGLVILDFDDAVAERELLAELGELQPTVETGSGRRHYYVSAPAATELPAKLMWKGKCAGEVQRTSAQQVVAPPSIHPTTAKPYVWLVDNPERLQELPSKWLGFLLSLPGHIMPGDSRGHEDDGSDEWRGEPAEVIVKRSLEQPGAKLRKNGVHFQCRGCKRLGRDRSMDNGIVFLTGKFTCCIFHEAHRSAIAEQLRLGTDYEEPEAPLAEDVPGHVDPMDYPLAEDVPGYVDPMDYPLAEDVPGYVDPMDYPLAEEADVAHTRTRRTRSSAAPRLKR
jgi:hypothetical protein